MTVVLTNDAMAALSVSHKDIVEAVRRAYAGLAAGSAESKLRERLYVEQETEDQRAYFFGYHVGCVQESGVTALRVDSMFMRTEQTETGPRTVRDSDFSGLILLFSLKTAELVGILQDHWISTRRVAATSAVGADVMARVNSRVMGLLGTGEQARQHVPAMRAVRDIQEVRVYSPNSEHRRRFAAEVTEESGCLVRAMDSAEAAVRECDIVVAATSSQVPVLEPDWLSPGTHLCSIVGGDGRQDWRELSSETIARADFIAINSKKQAEHSRQPKLLEPVRQGLLRWADVVELAELVYGRCAGRQTDAQITLHDNNCGMGIQFAAVGQLVLNHALKNGTGVTMDRELFVTRGGTYVP